MGRSPDFKINRTLADLLSEERKPKLLPSSGWCRVSLTEFMEGYTSTGVFTGSTDNVFANEWHNVVDGFSVETSPAGWHISESGEVRMRGKIAGGAGFGEIAFQLPEEARPQTPQSFEIHVDDSHFVDLSPIKFRAWMDDGLDA